MRALGIQFNPEMFFPDIAWFQETYCSNNEIRHEEIDYYPTWYVSLGKNVTHRECDPLSSSERNQCKENREKKQNKR